METNGPIRDYLKYWGVVDYYIQKKYDITRQDLSMLFFLYSEVKFDNKIFNEYNMVFNWDMRRMRRLIQAGWIMEDDKFSRNRDHKVFCLTLKAKRMIGDIYKILDGSMPMPMNKESNPLFQSKEKTTSRARRVAREVVKINNMLKGKS